MHWAAPYIGLKHKPGARGPEEVDCWGLVRLIYHEKFGISLPDYPGVTTNGAIGMSAIIQREADSQWEVVEKPFDGAVVAMSQRHAIHHVGIFTTADGGRYIHCWDSQNVIVDTLVGIKLKGFRLIRYYRHKLWPLSSKP